MVMELIFHIALKADWEKAKVAHEYRVESLQKEGYIHCSTKSQVLPVANAFFKGTPGLLLLEIDPKKLKSKLKYEDAQPKIAGFKDEEQFPHVYGPINEDAVIEVKDFTPNAAGFFQFPK
jgi:uncharacterized protein (DUF952 family)